MSYWLCRDFLWPAAAGIAQFVRGMCILGVDFGLYTVPCSRSGPARAAAGQKNLSTAGTNVSLSVTPRDAAVLARSSIAVTFQGKFNSDLSQCGVCLAQEVRHQSATFRHSLVFSFRVLSRSSLCNFPPNKSLIQLESEWMLITPVGPS